MKKTIEHKVADTILEKKQTITLGDKKYEVAPPTLATIVEVSSLISELPEMDTHPDNLLIEALRAKDGARVLSDILATLILGTKGLISHKKVVKSYFFGLIKRSEVIVVDEKKRLSDVIFNDLEPKRISAEIGNLLGDLQTGFFFGTMASLDAVNLIKPTKETETTASGH